MKEKGSPSFYTSRIPIEMIGFGVGGVVIFIVLGLLIGKCFKKCRKNVEQKTWASVLYRNWLWKPAVDSMPTSVYCANINERSAETRL